MKGHGRYLTSEAQVPGPPNLGGKNILRRFFFRQKLQGQIGGKFSGITGRRSYTVPKKLHGDNKIERTLKSLLQTI